MRSHARRMGLTVAPNHPHLPWITTRDTLSLRYWDHHTGAVHTLHTVSFPLDAGADRSPR